MDSRDLIEEYFDHDTSKERKNEIWSQIQELGPESDEKILLELGSSVASEEKILQLKSRMSKMKPRRKDRIYLKIAASLIFLISISFLLYWQLTQPVKNSPDQLFQTYYQPYDGMIVSRGGEPASLEKGVTAYNSEKYEDALAAFLKYHKQEPTAQLNLLISSCYLSLDQVEKSLLFLDRIEDDEGILASSNRDWYRALVYLKSNELKESKNLLKSLVESNSPFKQKAQELLQESIFN